LEDREAWRRRIEESMVQVPGCSTVEEEEEKNKNKKKKQ
jgi:hypothetical protein